MITLLQSQCQCLGCQLTEMHDQYVYEPSLLGWLSVELELSQNYYTASKAVEQYAHKTIQEVNVIKMIMQQMQRSDFYGLNHDTMSC